LTFQCEHCGKEEETEAGIEIGHRACRLKAAFPGSYSGDADGLVTFDMGSLRERLGLFVDVIVDTDSEPIHPTKGNVHFRIAANWAPEVWIELPVRVGNALTSFSYRLSEHQWQRLIVTVNDGLKRANEYLKKRKQERA
jgi:hypothetical protein